MKTQALIELIGKPGLSIIISGRHGNVTFHDGGFLSCDPCYLPYPLNAEIRAAYHLHYPWEGYDYPGHKEQWSKFTWRGMTCYARDCSDGIGYFGNCVDAGWVVVIPFPKDADGKVINLEACRPDELAAAYNGELASQGMAAACGL